MDMLRSDSLEVVSLADLRVPVSDLSSMAGGVWMPDLECLLEHIGPLPQEALFLGQAEDDCPVLLNLHDPVPGPLLILGRAGAGKTLVLRSIVRFVESTHTTDEIQFGVITNRVEEWQNTLAGSRHCVGVFASDRSGARRFVHSLEMWLRGPNPQGQSVLMLVDGFDELLSWDDETLDCLRDVLSYGPNKRVWPIVTLDPALEPKAAQWLDLFRVQMPQYGLVLDKKHGILDVPPQTWDMPVSGPWFMLQKQSGWIRFWIPSVSDS